MNTPDPNGPDVNDVVRRGLPCEICHVVTSDLDRHNAWHLTVARQLEALERLADPGSAPSAAR